MSLNIGRALQEGVVRTFTRNGLALVVAMGLLGALNSVAYNSAMAGLLPESPDQPTVSIGPTLSISPSVAGVAVVVLYLASFVVTVVALRTFVTDETRTIPRAFVTRNLGWVLLNYVVGYAVFLIAVSIGFLLLIVPGLFVLVSLYFWFVLVAVEDQNFVEAFRDSWSLTRGNRWPLLGLGLIVFAAAAVVFGVLFAVSFVLSPWVVLLVYAVPSAIYGVFIQATTARAYVQLAEEGSTDEPAGGPVAAA